MISFYERNQHKEAEPLRLQIELEWKFPGERVPHKSTLYKLLKKWNNDHTAHNVNKEKSSLIGFQKCKSYNFKGFGTEMFIFIYFLIINLHN